MSGGSDLLKILILGPSSLLYRLVIGLRNLLYDRGIAKTFRVGAPVISVGNIVAGGTGKTPMVILLAEILADLGYRPAIVSRGYRRIQSSFDPLLVSDGERILCSEDEAGDEPYLLARKLLGRKIIVVVSADRLAAAFRAIERGAEVIVLDDGFQHRRMARELDIVLLDSRRPLENGWLLPAGLLREPPSALKRADLLILTRWSADAVPDIARYHRPEVLVLCARHVPGPLWEIDSWRRGGKPVSPESIDEQVVLFSGLARPESFEQSVAELGLRIEKHLRYPDHHHYRPSDLKSIEEAGSRAGILITTEKDAARLPRDWKPRPSLYVLSVSMQMAFPGQKTSLVDLIKQKLGSS